MLNIFLNTINSHFVLEFPKSAYIKIVHKILSVLSPISYQRVKCTYANLWLKRDKTGEEFIVRLSLEEDKT